MSAKCQKPTMNASFDDLVGDREQAGRQRDAKRARSLQVMAKLNWSIAVQLDRRVVPLTILPA